MAQDWSGERLGEGVPQLIARKQYNQAIDVLRARLQQKRPDPKTRLRLADLLAQAGRGAEAVPMLLGLSDDFAAQGELSKAMSVLKRIEKLRPGMPDVGLRLDRLVAQHRATLGAPPPAAEASTAPGPTPAEPTPPPSGPEGPPAPAAAASDGAAAAPAAPLAPASETVVLRIRGLLGRLLGGRGAEPKGRPGPEATRPAAPPALEPVPASASVPPGGAELDASTFMTPAPPAPPAPVARPAQVGDGQPTPAEEPAAAGEPLQAAEPGEALPILSEQLPTPSEQLPLFSEPLPILEPVTGEEAGSLGPDDTHPPRLIPALEALSETTDPVFEDPPQPASSEPPLSEDAFHERVLDVVEEALLRPPEPAEAAAASAPAPSPGLDPSRLQSSPLFVELDDDELRQLVRDLKLRTFEPGDVVLTEGEQGQTLFLLVAGQVKVFVRDPRSRSLAVQVLSEGDFFGEVGVLSGRPRIATIVAATPCELLELERPTLERLGSEHPGILDTLEAYYLVRTQSDSASTLRSAVANDPQMQRRAEEALRAHFGAAHWDARMRLKLADLLLKSGKPHEALPVLAGLADELARRGQTEKAVAILKRIERIEGRHTEQIALAPLRRPPEAPASEPAPARGPQPDAESGFHGWLLELVHESVERGQRQRGAPTAPGLLLSPLFEDFSEEELLALVRGLRLLELEPGDVVITEGEEGNSVFVLTSGAVKVFVRDPRGHDVLVGRLREGDFFGEISLLSGRPRCATITAMTACELLELDQATLERICAEHPRVRAVLEDVYIERASHPLAALVRSAGFTAPG